ncbi:NHLP leader peptide family RiPP precursor [Caenimonas soli]|uniref:NHLP leader peptide family RiPP precursor n=1 Tax=Caenimonas soli TaxID=2735555 RepID=UPI0015537D02|nr:NHLP leader peptide family RiPP precursor [Caenimonas soli]NPC59385.1 NHLP leader peptide family natural product precursor [Caenimonas soli]
MTAKLTKEAWADVVAKAWKDPDFKQRLLADPRKALAESGLPLPGGVQVNVVENRPDTVNLILPNAPDDLEKFAANTQLAFTCCTVHIPVC